MSENHPFDPTKDVNIIEMDPEKDNKAVVEKSTAIIFEEYQTPKLANHKIPITGDCPPAPEKPREARSVNGELLPPGLGFFETGGLEAVEVFLKACMENEENFISRKRLFDTSS